MPTNTPNINLAKPLVTENYDIDILNENFDKLDLAMAGAIGFPVVNASAVNNTPSGNISSTNVQGAINELDNEKAGKLFATNLVTNGDFSNGTTSWTGVGGVLSSNANKGIVTGNGTLALTYLNQIIGTFIAGHKYYVRVKAKVTNSLASALYILIAPGTSGTPISVFANGGLAPVIDTQYNISAVIAQTDQVGDFNLRVRANYVDSATANGKVLEVQYVSAINLTTLFGAGNEPTKEQMDKLLSVYPDSWFNGTSEIGSIGALMRATLGAQVVTPTLLNSRTGTAQYVVSNDGLVIFRGTASGGSLNTNIFVLPENIRPAATRAFPISANNAFGVVTVAANGEVRQTVGALTNVFLDGIAFKVGV